MIKYTYGYNGKKKFNEIQILWNNNNGKNLLLVAWYVFNV